VEHYAYDHTLLRTIEGKTARTLYTTIVRNGWVTDLGHAAYLGKELARAERSLREGTRFVQDGA
jgi:tetrahydromethanopterin S-methyltransferase subunit A